MMFLYNKKQNFSVLLFVWMNVFTIYCISNTIGKL